jgi:hypothetical protein
MGNKKDSFIFYRSFYESISVLEDEDRLTIFDAICNLALNQEETELKPLPNAMFTLIKPQIDANNRRYNNGKKGGRPSKSETKTKPNDNLDETKAKANVNDNVNDNVNVNKPFSFSLTSTKQLSNTSKEYKEQLEQYINSNFKGMSYKEFYDSCEMKGYKYKNYKMVYDKWNKNYNVQSDSTDEWKA